MNFTLIRIGELRNKYSFNSPLAVHPPLGLMYIASSLEGENQNVRIIDFTQESYSIEKLENSIYNSDAVGINVQTKYLSNVVKVTEIIKEIDPKLPIIIGGAHCTFYKEKALEDIPKADICVVGDGEYVICDIVKYFRGKQPLSEINGLYYRKNNTIKQGKPPIIKNNLDDLEFPSRNLVKKYNYGELPGYNNILKKKFTTMITSRGCPSNCRFCCQYQNVIKNYKYRQRSAENVVEELTEIDKEYNSVMIIDDNFLIDPMRANKIFDLILENNIKIDILLMGARVDSVNKTLYKNMKRGNVKLISFGIESGNQDVLDYYNKKITLNNIRKAVEMANDFGFITYGSFIFGAPFETSNHFDNTIKFACSLPLDIADFRPLEYQKGSDLWFEAVKQGKITESEDSVLSDSKRGLGNFTSVEIEDYIKKAYRNFYFRPKYLFNQIHKSLMRKEKNIFLNGLRLINFL